MVWSPGAVSVEFRDVLRRQRFSVLYSILKYTFLLSSQKSNTNLTNLVCMNIKVDEVLSKIDTV